MGKATRVRRVPSNIPPRGPWANANLDQIQESVNSITNDQVSATAAISRSKLANTETETITFDKAPEFKPSTGAPFTTTSSTKVTNLNAESVDGKKPATASGLATLDANSKVVQHSSFEGVASGVATLNASTKVVERLSYEAAASGVATLDADSKLVQDAKTLQGKLFASVMAAVTITSGTNTGTAAFVLSGITTLAVVTATLQNADILAAGERPFDVGLDTLTATGGNVSVTTAANVAADRVLSIGILAYGS